MISIAIIGCGHWGKNHIRVFSELPGCDVRRAVDFEPSLLHATNTDYPDIVCSTDYRSVVADPEIDAVVVATPTVNHFEVVKQALQNGKHVLCEKPLCAHSNECRILTKLARENNCILRVGHVFLHNSAVKEIRQLIAQKAFGQTHYLRAVRTNLGPIRHDVNAIYDLATHDISIFNYLFDAMPLQVSAVGADFGGDGLQDMAFINLRYPNDIHAHIHVSWIEPRKKREITIVGEKKMLVWDDMNTTTPLSITDKEIPNRDYVNFNEFLALRQSGEIEIPMLKPSEPLVNQNQAFLVDVASGTAVNDGPLATDIVAVIEGINASMDAHGAPIMLG